MGFIENLKWWQWIIVSLLIGAALGFINANTVDPPASRVLEPLNFEERLIQPAIVDHGQKIPWISNIVVHPPQYVPRAGKTVQRQMVEFRLIVLPQEGGTGKAELCSMLAPWPYIPTPHYGPRAHLHYPGTTLYRAQPGDTMQSVLTKQYGKYSSEALKAFVTCNFYIFSRATSAADIRIVPGFIYYVPWNPADGHSIGDFLREAAKLGYDASFQYRWMEIPKYVYPIWMGGSFLIIGLIWPMLLRMMLDQGLGRDHSQQFDLRRYKSSSPKPAAAAAGPTAQEQQRLIDLEQSMLASLKAQQASEPAPPPAPAPAPSPVVKLAGAAPASPQASESPEREKMYEGEYYPVDRTGPDKDQKKK
jgi:hypothetical protein